MKKIKEFELLPNDATYDEINSPVGVLTLITSFKGLHAVWWDNYRENHSIEKVINRLKQSKNNPINVKTKQQLQEYFQGKRQVFDLPLVMNGTDFQIRVWKELQKIPYATTISYGEQARRLGDKNKARAVGTANGHNPISIIIPCHRVIGSNGQLTGFGGGLDKKAILLNLEKTSLNQL